MAGPIHIELGVYDTMATCDLPPPSELNLVVRDEEPQVVLDGMGEVVSFEIDEDTAGGGPTFIAKLVLRDQPVPMNVAVRMTNVAGSPSGLAMATYEGASGPCTLHLRVLSGTYTVEERPGPAEPDRGGQP